MIDKIIEQQETIKGMQENEESAIKIMKMYEDYKLRVDKAIEYIDKHIRIDDEYPNYMEMLVEEKNELLEILKGSDNYE